MIMIYNCPLSPSPSAQAPHAARARPQTPDRTRPPAASENAQSQTLTEPSEALRVSSIELVLRSAERRAIGCTHGTYCSHNCIIYRVMKPYDMAILAVSRTIFTNHAYAMRYV